MNHVVIAVILATCFVPYLAQQGWVPKRLEYLQEVLGIVVAAYVVAVGLRSRFRYVAIRYWYAFGALAVVMVCGVFANGVESGPLFAGLRTYLRALPLFFLPAVLAIDDRQLRRQLLLLLAVSLVQAPIALHQRFTMWDKGHASGDWVVGTILNSAHLSIFLICAACVLTAMYLRRRIRFFPYILLLAIVLVPTTINETKGTLFLLPLGLMTTLIVGARPGRRLRHSLLGVGVLAGFLAVFIPVYDYYVVPRFGYGIVDFFMQGKMEEYLDKDAQVGAVKAGRLDALRVPVMELARDPAQLAFGYGVGNASPSALGESFTGEHFRRFEPFLLTTATVLMLEIGLLGCALAMLLHFLFFRDAVAVAARDRHGLQGAFATGWAGAILVMGVTMVYKVVLASGPITFLYLYFCGVVAACRMRLAMQPAQAAVERAEVAPQPGRLLPVGARTAQTARYR